MRRVAGVRGQFQSHAADDEPDQHARLAPAGAAGEIAGTDPLGHERAHPGVPGGPAGHARRPIDGDHGEDQEHGHRAPQRRADQRHERQRLDHGAQHHPAAIAAQAADDAGGRQLHQGPDHQRHAGDQPGSNITRGEGQHECRQIHFPDSHHHAGCRAVGTDGVKVLSQNAQHGLRGSNEILPQSCGEGGSRKGERAVAGADYIEVPRGNPGHIPEGDRQAENSALARTMNNHILGMGGCGAIDCGVSPSRGNNAASSHDFLGPRDEALEFPQD